MGAESEGLTLATSLTLSQAAEKNKSSRRIFNNPALKLDSKDAIGEKLGSALAGRGRWERLWNDVSVLAWTTSEPIS